MSTLSQYYAASQAVRDQWAKFDKAVSNGLTGAPLAQIDKKLVRLENECMKLHEDLEEFPSGAVSSLTSPI